MKVIGIAEDLTYDYFKTGGYNLVAPVLESDGQKYIQHLKDDSIINLVEMVSHIPRENRESWLSDYLDVLDMSEEEIKEKYTRSYKYERYDTSILGEDEIRRVDETIHIQPDMEISDAKMVVGVSLDEDVFIGNETFILNQLLLLMGSPKSDEEFDILYKVCNMTGRYIDMGMVIDAALNANLSARIKGKWRNYQDDYELIKDVEETIKKHLDKLSIKKLKK